jgi:hypothetical protein
VCIRGKTGSAVSVPLTLQVLIVGEQVLQPVLLHVGEQVGAGVQGPAGGVERVAVTATATAGVLLDPAAALVEGVTGQAHDMEGIHDRDRVGQFLGGGGLEPGEPVHRDDFDTVAPHILALAQPLLEGLLGAALDHVE